MNYGISYIIIIIIRGENQWSVSRVIQSTKHNSRLDCVLSIKSDTQVSGRQPYVDLTVLNHASATLH